MRRRSLVLALVLAALATVAGACDDSDEPEASVGAGDATSTTAEKGPRPCDREGGTEGFPVTVEAANGAVEIEREPVCIISMSPTSTEMLFAIGAGEQVLAVDRNSDFPAEIPKSGLDAYEPNIEAIARLEPDLVVISDDVEGLVAGLNQLEIAVVHHPAVATIDEAYAQMEQLGEATGHADEATELVEGMKADIDEITADLPELGEAPTYFHELDQQLFSVTSNTFIGQVYSLAGLENIADAAADEGNDYPQLSAEYVVESDPDLIFLADAECCQQSARTIAERPGWDGLSAIEAGNVVELDEDVASRWGPRIVDFLRTIVDAAKKLAGEGSAAG